MSFEYFWQILYMLHTLILRFVAPRPLITLGTHPKVHRTFVPTWQTVANDWRAPSKERDPSSSSSHFIVLDPPALVLTSNWQLALSSSNEKNTAVWLVPSEIIWYNLTFDTWSYPFFAPSSPLPRASPFWGTWGHKTVATVYLIDHWSW